MAETGPGIGEERRWTPMLIIGAFVVIGGFMYWLSIKAEPTSVALQEDADTVREDPTVPTVEIGTFSLNPLEYEQERIRLRNIRVASTLGPEAFWFQLPDETPYLVKLDSTLVVMGTGVSSGDMVRRIEGRVYAMSDSVLDAWEAQGIFTNPTQRIEAEFATSFVHATVVDVPSASGGGGGAGGQSGGGGG